jgi:hypothetical protein
MFQQSKHCKVHKNFACLSVIIGLLLFHANQAVGDDALGAWLRRMECNQLLALHLEKYLEIGSAKEQAVAAQELADLYATMLVNADDETRKTLLENAKALIKRKPALATTDLTLQLLRGSYLSAEQVIEQFRFRIVSPESHAIAISQMREVHGDLAILRPGLVEKLRNSRGQNSEIRAKNAGLCTTLLAWSGYYLARHDHDPDAAVAASTLFAEVLGVPHASLQEISTDLSIYEYGARALLGIALCKEVANDPAGSEPWFELLEENGVWDTVRRQIPLWRLHVLIDAKRWGDILALVDGDETAGGLRDYWLLLIASRALEDSYNVNAELVSAAAVEQLVKLGQLNMVSGLVDTYGQKVLAETNFVGKYIVADLQYQQLRKKWEEVTPSEDVEVLAEFAAIGLLLEEAIASSDAAEFPFAKVNCKFLLAHARYQAGNFSAAADTFYQLSVGSRMEEALWMAIISLNYINDRTFEQEELRDLAIEQYITAFPGSERARQLIVHRSFDENQDQRSLDELLSIPFDDPMYDKARRRAEDLLYLAWRNAPHRDKTTAGNHYLEIARPLLLIDAGSRNEDFAQTVRRSRRILDVALHQQVKRTLAAENVFKVIEEYEIDEEDVQIELLYRELQLLLLQNKLELALDIGILLRSDFSDSPWNDNAAVSLINAMREAPLEQQELHKKQFYALTISYIKTRTPEELGEPGLFSVAVEVVQKGVEVHTQTLEVSSGIEALSLVNRLLEISPQNKSLLRNAALLEESLGDSDLSLQHWKKLSNGLSKGTGEWFEARYKFIALLFLKDPDMAEKVFLQHIALYPEFATPPFDEHFKELHKRIKSRTVEEVQP